LTTEEVTMSVVSPQERLAGAWDFAADEPKINGNNVQPDGELTIKGVTKALELELEFVQAG
jgi:hypothetical protein